jgi:hypothetical protein
LSYDETGFLGRDDDAYARQAWNFMLSGGSVFDHLDYSFSVGHEDGTDLEKNGPGGGSPELRKRLRILSEFLRGLPLVEMSPDFSLVKHAGGVMTHTLSSPHREYATYVDGKGPTELTLNLPNGLYDASWVDVATGQSLGSSTLQGGGDRVVKSPAFRNGVALRVRRRESTQ